MLPQTRKLPLSALTATLLLALTPSCQQIPKSLPPAGPEAVTASQLRIADRAITQAKRADTPQERAAHALLAAEIAWDLDWKASGPVLQHSNRKAAKVYDAALAELLTSTGDRKEPTHKGKSEYLIAGLRGDYRLTVDQSVFDSLREYPEFRPAYEYRGRRGFRRRVTREGIGLPIVAINRDAARRGLRGQSDGDTFRRREGYTTPRTAILVFDKPPPPGKPRDVRLRMVDPRKVTEEKVGKRVLPVAADLTAPLMAAYPKFGSMLAAVRAAINPDILLPFSGIYAIELYDPERIPVLLVHGLFSTPDMWKNLINELNAAPGVGNRFQFYTFTYPTGLPPVYTASMLRQKIALAHAETPLPQGYILIGHSMGGILSRMQITNSELTLWNRTFGPQAERALEKISPNDPVYRSLVFKADPLASRAIFANVPHRGSPMAERGIVRWFAGLARFPYYLTQEIAASPLRVLNIMPDRLPSSAQGLSPNSSVLIGLDTLPMTVPVHTIVGNRGRSGPLAESSDGVVPYTSAHLEAAASEKVVPANHGGFDHPEAIAEMERILREHPKTTYPPKP